LAFQPKRTVANNKCNTEVFLFHPSPAVFLIQYFNFIQKAVDQPGNLESQLASSTPNYGVNAPLIERLTR